MRFELGTGLSVEDRMRADEVLEKLRQRLAKAGLGVTVVGNRLTLRWNDGSVPSDELLSASAVLLEVDDGLPPCRCDWCGSEEGVEATEVTTLVGRVPKTRSFDVVRYQDRLYLCSGCRCPK